MWPLRMFRRLVEGENTSPLFRVFSSYRRGSTRNPCPCSTDATAADCHSLGFTPLDVAPGEVFNEMTRLPIQEISSYNALSDCFMSQAFGFLALH